MAREVAKAEMLIRRPIAEVFDAFVHPDTITKFWLESTTGPLAAGVQVKWRFMVPGATETVTVTSFEDQRRIAFDWSDGISVDMNFEERGGTTRIAVELVGFKGDHIVEEVVTTTEGFKHCPAISRRCSKWVAQATLFETKPN